MVTKQCPALWASLSCWGEIWSPCHSPPLSQKSPGNPGKRMKYIKDDSIDRSLGKMIAARTCLTHGGSRGQLQGTSPASFCSSSKLPSPPRRAVAELWIPPDPQQLTGTFSPPLHSHGHACVLLQGQWPRVGLWGIFYSCCIQAAILARAAPTFNSSAGSESWKENVFNASPALWTAIPCAHAGMWKSLPGDQRCSSAEGFDLKAGC